MQPAKPVTTDAPLLTVCQLGRLGDIVATEPAYRFLHERHPDRRLRWYTRPQYAELLRFAPFVDEIVTISDAVIENRFQQKSSPATIIIGGVCGSVRNMPEANDTSAVTVARVQSDIRVSIRNGYGAYNFIGGIIGSMSLKGTGSIQDCASDLSVEIATDMDGCYGYDKCFGAFGSMLAFNSTVTVANVFSKVAVNKIHDVFHGYEAFRANAIIGETSQYKQPDGTVTGELRLRNLFGFVEQTEESTGETEIDTQLYEIPDHAVYTATNCQGCEQLPEHHGLDENVWDLSDPAKPKLKES